MKKENKQALISLSLAGAIGYYLYNKLTASGFAIKKSDFSVKAQTEKDLSWRPSDEVAEEIVEEVAEEIVEDVVENVAEEVAEDDTFNVDDLFDNIVADDFVETMEPVAENVAETVEEAVVADNVEEVIVDAAVELVEEPEVIEDVEDAEPVVETIEEIVEATEEPAEVEPAEEIVVEEVVAEEVKAEEVAVDDVPDNGAELIKEEESFAADLAIEPALEFEAGDIKAEDAEIEIEVQDAPAVIETEEDDEEDDSLQSLDELQPLITPITLDDDDEGDDTSVEDLFEAMSDDKIMENTEALHKVDNNEPNAKQEFQSIMDFFNTL